MFGIGLPEMIIIMALALIVIGPDKLPDFARSIAKGIMELKKTAEGLKESLNENGNPLDDIRPELENTAKDIEENLLEATTYSWKDGIPPKNRNQLDSTEPENYVEVTPENDQQADDEIENAPGETLDSASQPQDGAEPDTTNSSPPKVYNSVKDDLSSGSK